MQKLSKAHRRNGGSHIRKIKNAPFRQAVRASSNSIKVDSNSQSPSLL